MMVYFDNDARRVVVSVLENDFAPRSLRLVSDNGYWIVQRSNGRRKVGPLNLSEVVDEAQNAPADPVDYLNGVFDADPDGFANPPDILSAIASLDAGIN